MTRLQLLQRFRTVASEIAERDLEEIREQSTIAELGMDSLSTLELVGCFERELHLHIPNESLNGVRTIGDFLDVVESHRST